MEHTIETLTGIENTLQHHLDIASDIVPNKILIRSWQTKLRTLLAKQNETIVRFLEKPKSDWPCMKQHIHFIHRNTNTEWLQRNVEPIVNNEEIVEEINAELGESLVSIQTKLNLVMDKYKTTVQLLFEANEALQKKLSTIESIQKKLDALTELDEEEGRDNSEELLSLQESILKYVQRLYDSLKIKDNYVEFCRQYARFSAFRSILHSLQVFGEHTNTQGGIMCTICTTDQISMALVPCGHTFCNTCAVKQRSQCYICRTTIREKQKIYFM
jgi:hypothetical protein